MSGKSRSYLKPKLIKKSPFSKPPSSMISSSLYSGATTAEFAVRKPGSPLSVCFDQTKSIDEQLINFLVSDPDPPPQYHPWELKYSQLLTREKIKKSMTKDSYIPRTRVIAHANESITTEEECCPVLIPADAIQIKKPIVRKQTKSLVPNIVRYVRRNDLMPSERPKLQIPVVSQLQVEIKTSIPTININNTNGIAPVLATPGRLLHRAAMRKDASAIRRSPRKLIMNTVYETISPLAAYG